jgi:hypothetical protein
MQARYWGNIGNLFDAPLSFGCGRYESAAQVDHWPGISGLGLGIGKRRVKPPKDCYSSITPAVQNIAEDHR